MFPNLRTFIIAFVPTSSNRWKCEVVHGFRNEDPNCASLHPTGFQVRGMS